MIFQQYLFIQTYLRYKQCNSKASIIKKTYKGSDYNCELCLKEKLCIQEDAENNLLTKKSKLVSVRRRNNKFPYAIYHLTLFNLITSFFVKISCTITSYMTLPQAIELLEWLLLPHTQLEIV